MSLAIQWHPAAERQLLALGWRTAATVAGAVQRFAESGEGTIERIPTAPNERYLRLPRFVVRFSIMESVLHVSGVFPT